MSKELQHQPVLIDEVIEHLNIIPNGIYIDGTFGRGGHSRAILGRLGEQGMLLAIDKDPAAVEHARRCCADPRMHVEQGSFASLAAFADHYNLVGKVDGILLDLGVSSPQLDDPQRGFSFMQEGPLDMRMDPTQGISASEWLANVSAEELAQVLKDYGEERFAKRIAAAVVQERGHIPLTTTRQLANIVAAALPFKERHKHPATRTFQAIRIFINRELDDLKSGLTQCVELLKMGGRLLVISFHSLEDRIVKKFMQTQQRGPQLPAYIPVKQAAVATPKLRRVGPSKIRASAAEIARNPRARSAVLRISERIS